MVALCDAVEGAFRIGRLLGLDENAEMLARSTKARFWRSPASGVSRHPVGRQHERGTAPISDDGYPYPVRRRWRGRQPVARFAIRHLVDAEGW